MVCDAVAAERFAIFTNANDAERYTSWRHDIDRSLADCERGGTDPPADRRDVRSAAASATFGDRGRRRLRAADAAHR